jgi:2-isopropylmalate synthase
MKIEYEGIYDWNKHQGSHEPVRTPRSRVEIDDETWRDGMQGSQVERHPSVEQKDMYIRRVAELGYIDHLDIGFPASGVLHRNSIVDLVNSSNSREDGLTFSVAGRGSAIDDAKAILEVAEKVGHPLEADLFLDASNMRAFVEGWDRNEKIRQLSANIGHLKQEGLSVMFVPERASVTMPEELFEVCKIALEVGADRIAIADTTGVLTPTGTSNIFRETFDRFSREFSGVEYDFHEHNDLGMGIANCIVAAEEGVDRLHATARGIGERAGNVNLEQLLVVLNLRGFRNVNTSEIQNFARMASEILHVPIQPHEPIVGERSTETASGVHASTYEKIRHGEAIPSIYSFDDPKKYGLELKVQVGPMSGISNVRAVLDRLNIEDATEEIILEILDTAKSEWGLLSDDRIREIVGRNGSL